jgi:hypothetical protein
VTYTVATLEVSAAAFDEIAAKLRAAGYDHCFDEAGLVDMTHIALVRAQAGRLDLAIECRRRTTPNKDACRLKPEHVMDIARLANLRMWDAYEARHAESAELVQACAKE